MSDSELVTMTPGYVVPLKALQLLWDLENRGLDVRVDGTDIVVRPRSRVTDADREHIRLLKPHLISLIAFCLQASDQHLREEPMT